MTERDKKIYDIVQKILKLIKLNEKEDKEGV